MHLNVGNCFLGATGSSLAIFSESWQHGWWPLALFFALLLLLLIVAPWISSKAVSVDRGTFVNVLKLLFSYLACTVMLSVVIRIALAVTSGHGHPAGGTPMELAAYVSLTVAGLLYLWALFVIPIGLYRLQVAGVIGFMAVAGVLIGGGLFGLHLVFGHPFEVRLLDLGKDWGGRTLAWIHPPATSSVAAGPTPMPTAADTGFQLAEQRAADRTPQPLERQAALQDLYSRLEANRQELRPGDANGAAAYETRRQLYEQLLANLRADVAPKAKPAPSASPAQPAQP